MKKKPKLEDIIIPMIILFSMFTRVLDDKFTFDQFLLVVIAFELMSISNKLTNKKRGSNNGV